MNKDQRKILVYSLYGLSGILLLIFWRFGTQYEYTTSLLIFKISEIDAPNYLLPNGTFGLRLRLGAVGVIFGAILPIILAAAAAIISKSEKP